MGIITMYPVPDYLEWKSRMLQIPGIKKVITEEPPLMPTSVIGTVPVQNEDNTNVILESFRISEDFFDIYVSISGG